MMLESLIFYFFAVLLVCSAGLVIVARNPVYATLCLVLSFFLCASIWLLLYAEFLAILLILLYVGAVMVLFLFVVMMLDIRITSLSKGFTHYLPGAILVAIFQAASMVLVLSTQYFAKQQYPVSLSFEQDSNIGQLGKVLYTEYLWHFELAGVILLVAIIAAIALILGAGQTEHPTQTFNLNRQISANKKSRVRLIKMETDRS